MARNPIKDSVDSYCMQMLFLSRKLPFLFFMTLTIPLTFNMTLHFICHQHQTPSSPLTLTTELNNLPCALLTRLRLLLPPENTCSVQLYQQKHSASFPCVRLNILLYLLALNSILGSILLTLNIMFFLIHFFFYSTKFSGI